MSAGGGGGGGKSGGSSSMLGAFTGSFFEGLSTIRATEAQKNYLGDLEDSYNRDAVLQRRVGDRKLSLKQEEQDAYNDRLTSQLAQSGISFGGTSTKLFEQARVAQAQERAAIKLDTDIRVNESWRKASQARTQRFDINDNEVLDYTGAFLGGGARGYNQWGGG